MTICIAYYENEEAGWELRTDNVRYIDNIPFKCADKIVYGSDFSLAYAGHNPPSEITRDFSLVDLKKLVLGKPERFNHDAWLILSGDSCSMWYVNKGVLHMEDIPKTQPFGAIGRYSDEWATFYSARQTEDTITSLFWTFIRYLEFLQGVRK